MDLSQMAEHPAISLFKELLVPSPPGGERQLAGILRVKLAEMGWDHKTDPAGNILVHIPGIDGSAPGVCLAAHMDEIAIVVTKINSDGSLNVARSGGLFPWKLGEGPVEVIGDHETILGVFSMGSTHTLKSDRGEIMWEDCRILTGLSAGDLTSSGVRPGTYALPERSRRGPVLFGDPANPLVGAWTLDDRMGVVALLRLLKRIKDEALQPHQPTIVAFTVREEIGGHGAKSLILREQPEVFLAIDGAPIPPGTPLILDGRPAIWSQDRLAVYDQNLLASLQAIAVEAGTELQPVVYQAAASDASLVSYMGAAPRVACLGHVRENSHGYEVARLSVFDNLLDVLVRFIKVWGQADK